MPRVLRKLCISIIRPVNDPNGVEQIIDVQPRWGCGLYRIVPVG